MNYNFHQFCKCSTYNGIINQRADQISKFENFGTMNRDQSHCIFRCSTVHFVLHFLILGVVQSMHIDVYVIHYSAWRAKHTSDLSGKMESYNRHVFREQWNWWERRLSWPGYGYCRRQPITKLVYARSVTEFSFECKYYIDWIYVLSILLLYLS